MNCALPGMAYFGILETFCFSALGDEFLFSTFMRACFEFLRQKTGGEGGAGPSPCYSPVITLITFIGVYQFTILK